MKLVRFGAAGAERPGIWVEATKAEPARIVDVRAMAFDIEDYDARFWRTCGAERLKGLLREKRLKTLPAAGVRLGPPVAPPRQITRAKDRRRMELSTVSKVGDREVIRAMPFVQVKMALAAGHTTNRNYPAFDPLSVFAEDGEESSAVLVMETPGLATRWRGVGAKTGHFSSGPAMAHALADGG